jgi:CAAX protease family protein
MPRADALYVALIAVGLGLDSLVSWPAFLRRAQDQPSRARGWLWSTTMMMLWTLLAVGVALWTFERRSWTELRLVMPHGWRLLGTIVLLLAVAVVYARSVARITRRDRSRRIKVSKAVELRAPHTATELAWFWGLALSAGICEEFIFRGYLIWLFQSVLGLWGAAAVSLVLFAAAHSYQGAKGVIAVAVVGGVLTLIVLAFGSLISAMAVHTLVDVGEGLVGWLAMREVRAMRDGDARPGERLLDAV